MLMESDDLPDGSFTSTVIIDLNDDLDQEQIKNSLFQDLKSDIQPSINICLDVDLNSNEVHTLGSTTDTQSLPLLFKSALPNDKPIDSFPCLFEQCKKVFKSYEQLRKHYRNHQERKHNCQFCGQKFLYLKDKKIHERIHTGERPYQCHQCKKSFAQKITLANHLISHTKSVKSEICNYCGRSYYYKKSLAYHIRKKHSSQLGENFLVCSKCDKKFSGLCRYNLHVAKCQGKKNFTCEVCNTNFEKKSQLQAHKLLCFRSHVFQCGICDGVFQSEKVLRTHMQNRHRVGFDECFKVQIIQENSEKNLNTEETNQQDTLCS